MSDIALPPKRREIDVSGLPSFAFGNRDPLWWGVWLLIAIEGTMFALLVASYFYLRASESEWPPTGAAQPPLWITFATVIALLATIPPSYYAFRKALDGRLRAVQIGLLLTTILNGVAVVTRAYELGMIGYNWNSHAYGSLVWGIYFVHTLHLVSGLCENIVITALLFIGPVEKKHMVDVRLGTIYWWFVVVSWVILWAIVFGDSTFLRNSFVA
ncbi:MAG TPA: cytochrome c oxidase subunit 3 [Thermoanaerobaculia bacterium]|nr:cytochrome c oxidase subunit 3 [Thermoanaerobaculia bacterium]